MRPGQSGSWGGTIRKLVKFVWIGGLGAVLYSIMSTAAVWLGGDPQLSSLLSYSLLIPLIYGLQSRFSFASAAVHRTAFPRYVAVQAMALVLSFVLPRFIQSVQGTANAISFIVIAIIIGVLNFLALLLWAFATSRK